MSTHNIGFHWKIRKLANWILLKSRASEQESSRPACTFVKSCQSTGCQESYNSYIQLFKRHSFFFLFHKNILLTLVLLSPDIPCFCKQCRSRLVGFWRSQLIWICTVCHQICEFIATIWIKQSDWLKIRSRCGILIYSTGQGLRIYFSTKTYAMGIN